MTEHERRDDREQQRRVKVTDKRRVHAEGAESSARSDADPDAGARAEEGSGAATRPSAHGSERPESPARGGEAAQGPSEAEAPEPGNELERARAQAAEYLDHLQRLKAEFDNYRKRVIKEQTRAVELATEPMMGRLLEVLDEFELALVAAEQEPRFDKFVRGVEMVYAKLFDILRAEGLERIDAEGKPFDPEIHEALLHSGADDGDAYVADVLRTGYTLKGRVIRPAGVKVGRR